MFKSLKEKLKNWVAKNDESEEDVVQEVSKKSDKKDSKKSDKKDSKKVEKKADKKSPKKPKEKKEEVVLEKSKKELKEEEKEKKRLERENLKEEKKKKREEKKAAKSKELDELEDAVEETEELLEEVKEEVEEIAEGLDEQIEIEMEEVREEKPAKRGIFGGKELTEEKFEEMFEELEMILLTNNVSYSAVDLIKEKLNKSLVGKSLKSVDLAAALRKAIEELLINPSDFVMGIKNSLKEKSPYVVLFSGINGAGKTTSIAKVAYLLKKNGLSVCLVAADTFRAAAIQQLEEHAKKLEVPIVKKDYGTDPASVGFDGIRYAQKNKIDVVLIDTAGRLQNRDSLMKEIEKISRVCKPDLKIFLGESITGNDATEQAKVFNETIEIDGIILSKADVDEKGGTAISVASVTGKPILFLGTGQEYDDLEVFDKEKVLEQLGL